MLFGKEKAVNSDSLVCCSDLCCIISQRAGLNRRPLPYHGNALPTELRWHMDQILQFPFVFSIVIKPNMQSIHEKMIVLEYPFGFRIVLVVLF